MVSAGGWILKAQNNGQYHNGTHQTNNTPGSMLTIGLPVYVLQMLISPLDMRKGFLNVKVNAINKWALVNDEFVELPIDCSELVDGLD